MWDTSEQASLILEEGEACREHELKGERAASTAVSLLELLHDGDSIRFQNIERNVALVVISSLDLKGKFAILQLGYEPIPSTYTSLEEAAVLIASFLE